MLESSQTPDLFSGTYSSKRDFPFYLIDEHRDEFSAKFAKWLPLNLHIFASFCERAKAMKRIGKKRYGADGIIAVVRFETELREKPEYEFKINNNYTADLARLAMFAYPELQGFFRTKERSVLTA